MVNAVFTVNFTGIDFTRDLTSPRWLIVGIYRLQHDLGRAQWFQRLNGFKTISGNYIASPYCKVADDWTLYWQEMQTELYGNVSKWYSHTHTHTHSYPNTHAHTHIHTYSLSHTFTLTHTRTHALSHTFTFTHTHTRTHALSLAHIHTHSHKIHTKFAHKRVLN